MPKTQITLEQLDEFAEFFTAVTNGQIVQWDSTLGRFIPANNLAANDLHFRRVFLLMGA